MEKVLTDLDRVNIAKQEYELGSQLDTLVKIMSQDKVLPIGKVAHVQDGGKETGEQIYTITPNGTLDKPEDVKEVTVLFKGSTAPFGGDDWKTDWFKNDIPIASKLLLKKFGSQSVSHKQGTKQLEQSAHLLKEVMNKYPNAKISVYGHSLGSMNAQYAIAELDDNQIYRVQGAWIYNGPNLYSILTDKQKEQVDKIKGVVNNYVDSKDKIGIGYPKEGSDNAVGIVKIVDSKAVSGGSWVANFTNQHIWGGYQYNQDGSLKLAEDKFAYKENYSVVHTNVNQRMHAIKAKLSSFKSTGKEVSKNQAIFLDSQQAKVISSGLVTISKEAVEEVKKVEQKAVAKTEELYQSLKVAPTGVTELSPQELEEAYAQSGVSYASIVGEAQTFFSNKIQAAESISHAYVELENQINKGVEAMLQQDSNLSGEFKQWH
ncbi:TPA: DUF2974 domain-containing protein [Streptococcus agalactiae]|nr:DUF2974 domain-containing protein [Streptococcus agalactiae]